MLHMLSSAFILANLASAWAAPMCSLRPPASASAAGALATNPPAASPSPSGTASTPQATGGNGGDIVATTWYAGYNSQYLAVEDIAWDKYTAVTFAFGEPQSDNSISLDASNGDLLPSFVQAAHSNNAQALVTIGGWTGSSYFSSAVATADNRTAFVKNCQALIQQFNLDGLDFDWEYPNKQGAGCNVINPQDTANFLSFLQELRTAEPNITLSAATSIAPWNDASGQPSTDLSGFAKVLDYVAIMNYDIWGSWSDTVGPNAPLNDTCAPAADQQGSAVSAVKLWTAAGIPANQLVLGVAGYGHSFDVSTSAAFASTSDASATTTSQPAGTTPISAYPSFDKTHQPFGDNRDANAPAGPDQCGVYQPGGPSGIFNFAGMIEQGILDQNGTAVTGMGFRFDSCSQTPYVYVAQNQTMISYDDTTSFAAKGKFIAEQGLRGFALWEASSDYNNLLVDAITNAIGVDEVSC